MRDGAPELLSSLLGALDPDLRAAAVFALGCLIHSQPRMGPGGAPLTDGRYVQAGSNPSSSAASLVMPSLGSGAAPGAAGMPPSGSAASLGPGTMDGSGGGAAAAAQLEASISSEQSIAALLLRANVGVGHDLHGPAAKRTKPSAKCSGGSAMQC